MERSIIAIITTLFMSSGKNQLFFLNKRVIKNIFSNKKFYTLQIIDYQLFVFNQLNLHKYFERKPFLKKYM